MQRLNFVNCPKCNTLSRQKVIQSDRNSEHIIIRRRLCFKCEHVWHTIQYPEQTIEDRKARYIRNN